ncbi:MAG TPA: bacteriohemerythrin [Desulfuromonadaceae bacterium]
MNLLRLYMNMSVRTKLFIFSGFFSLWILIIALIGGYNTHNVAVGVVEANETITDIVHLEELNNECVSLRLSLVYGLVHTSEDAFNGAMRDAENKITRIDKTLEMYRRNNAVHDDEQKYASALERAWSTYRGQALQLIALEKRAFSGDRTSAVAFAIEHVAPVYKELDAAITGFTKHLQSLNNNRYKKDLSQAKLFEWLAVALAVVSIVLAAFFSWLLTRSITRPILSLSHNARLIAEGDLRVEIQTDVRDEIGQLADSLVLIVNCLKEMISTLADSSFQISASSGVMQTSAGTMANAADHAVVQTTAVAVATEEMSATSGDISNNCNMAAESARRANEAACHGAVVVEGTISVMQRIAERVQTSAKTVEELGKQSDQIGSIIITIEDIADQTNLLALNAAIEAARAGEQGRGFAVVADEVRALAERTTNATREIGAMIQSIQKDTKSAVVAMEKGVEEVQQGTHEAARSGEALRNIQEEINSLTTQVHQMAAAAGEQTATTCEISSNIHQVTDVVKNTSDNARQCVSLSQQLATLSQAIKGVVGKFTFSESNAFFVWNSSYSVGCDSMDQEHKRLVEIINKLYGAMRQGKGNETIGSILDGLVDYARTHFAHEERLMKDAGYAAYEEHKREHDSLTGHVLAIQEKYRSGTVLSLEVMSFVKEWLVNHIQGSDKRYGPYVNKQENKQRNTLADA